MGPFVLPILAAAVVLVIVCAWIALDRYDKKHPNQDRSAPRRGR